MPTYHVKRHTDAHDSADEVTVTHNLTIALILAATEAMTLPNETGTFSFSEAGDTELFEVFPEHGRGTIVVEEVDD